MVPLAIAAAGAPAVLEADRLTLAEGALYRICSRQQVLLQRLDMKAQQVCLSTCKPI